MDVLHDASEGDIPALLKKSKLSPLPNFAAHGTREAEIDRLVDTLYRATQLREARHATPAQDVAIPTILDTIMDRMWDLVDPSEKLVWIAKDIFKTLVSTICINAKRSQGYATAIEICRHLIHDSREGSTAFARTVLNHLNLHKECSGVSDCLCQLIELVPLRSILIEELGVTKLMDIYTNITVEYNASLESIIKDTASQQNAVGDPEGYYKSDLPNDKGITKGQGSSGGLAAAAAAAGTGGGQSSNNFKLDTLQFNPPTRYFSAPSVLAKDGGKDGANHNQENGGHGHGHPQHQQHQHPNSINTNSPPPDRRSVINQQIQQHQQQVLQQQQQQQQQQLLLQQQVQQAQQQQLPLPKNPKEEGAGEQHDSARPRALSQMIQKSQSASIRSGAQTPTAASSPSLVPPRPVIPVLKLPPSRQDSMPGMSRSSRRDFPNSNRSNSAEGELGNGQITAAMQLLDYATKLGETFAATDLAALVSYKQAIDAHQARILGISKGLGYWPIRKLVPGDGKEAVVRSPIRPEVATLRASDAYKVKSAILKVLIALTSQPSLLKYIRSPVNVLYTELFEIYQNLVISDSEYKGLLYKLLANWADQVEFLHRNRWREITKGMSVERKIHFRKKLDKFLWRVHNNMSGHMEAAAYTEVNILLAMLGDYMSNCPTRVMSSQTVDVAMETLLKMKHLVFTRGKFTNLRLNDYRMMHNLLVVFDEVATQNMHLPLNDLLLALFVERDDTLTHIKDYVQNVLHGPQLENEIGKDATSKVTITDYRVRTVRHFEVCVDMIRMQAESMQVQQSGSSTPLSDDSSPSKNTNNRDSGNDTGRQASGSSPSSTENPHSTTEIHMKKLEFLVQPGVGLLLTFLSQGSHYENFVVKKHMLQLLCKIFELKGNPFVRKKSYVDAYVSYFYIRFIKLYQNYVLDPPTLELCQLYLRLLLAFSMCKTERIAMKFYQLKAMDFLVREISLEYEVKLNREAKDAMPFNLSTKLQKQKGKKDTGSFPPPPNQQNANQSTPPPPTVTTTTADSSQQEGTTGSSSEAFHSSQDNIAEHRKSTGGIVPPLRGIPLRDSANSSSSLSSLSESSSSKPTKPAIRIPPKEVPKDTPLPASTPSPPSAPEKPPSSSSLENNNNNSNKGEDKEALFTKTKVTPLNLSGILPRGTPESVPSSSAIAIPKLSLGGLGSASPSPPASSDQIPPPSSKPPVVPKLGLGGINASRESPRNTPPLPHSPSSSSSSSNPLNTSSSSVTASPAKPMIPSLKLPSASNSPVVSPKGKSPDPLPKKAPAIPSLKLPAVRSKMDKEESQSKEIAISLSTKPLGGLSAMEQKVDVNDPKFQLLFDNPAQLHQIYSTEALSHYSSPNHSHALSFFQAQQRPLTPADLLAENQRYSIERNNRKIYHAKDLHIAFLQLIFSLMLTHNYTLDPFYSDQFPVMAKKINIPFILHLHINHPQNEAMVSELVSATQTMGTPYFRLLKLLFIKIFNPLLYNDLERLATGAYGTVYKTKLNHNENIDIAVKLMATPKSIQDRCVLHDIFTEILILDKYKHDTRCCHLYDYGVDGESYWIIMKAYKCSLKEWRIRQNTTALSQSLPLYLNIFYAVLQTVMFLTENKVNHFDIKCDNFLLHPHPGVSEHEFWNQPSAHQNFHVCLADFGEAKVYSNEVEGYTTRNRGTEYIKSPEMLNYAYASQKTRDQYDRRKKVGSNSASDVWSIGCLLYELITGEFLFYDDDLARFFIRVTSLGQELLTEEKRAKIGNITPLIEFFEFIFIRDPSYRPTIPDVITKFQIIKTQILAHLAAQDERALIDRTAATRERSASVWSNVPRTPTTHAQPYIMARRDTIGEKYTAREPTTSRYSPGRYTPHIHRDPSFRLLTPHSDKPDKPPLTKSQKEQLQKEREKEREYQQMLQQALQAPQPKLLPAQQHNHPTPTPKPSTPLAPAKPTPRDSPFDLPPDPPLELEFPEHEYFMRVPSQITPFLYVSSYNPSLEKELLKHKLHITHIVNCTGSPNAFPDHFEYLHLKLHDENSQDILQCLQRTFDFIRDGHLHKGRVLIFSDKGISRSVALVIAYLMDSYSMSYLEAYLYIRDRRYIAQPNQGFVDQLCKWCNDKRRGTTILGVTNLGKSRTNGSGSGNANENGNGNGNGNGVEMPLDALFSNLTMEAPPSHYTWWQCYCGACTYALNGTFDTSKYQNPRSCSCLMDEPSDCPNINCSGFLDEMKKLHNFNAEGIVWGYAPQKNILMENLDRTTSEVHPLKGVPALMRSHVTRKDWRVFRCRTCSFLTHAISTLHPPSSSSSSSSYSPEALVAIVTNIPRRSLPPTG